MTEHLHIIENARIVAPDGVFHGWLAVEGGTIADFGEGQAPERGLDLRGDYLIPGLIELHTDHLESHFVPRPKVRWNTMGAVIAYDAQIAASGITTVFDSLRAGADLDGGGLGSDLMLLGEALDNARRQDLLRTEHLTHLRCEIPSPDLLDSVAAYAARFPVALMSLMDHTPGQRQFRDIDKYLIYYGGKSGQSMDEMLRQIERRKAENGAIAAANRPRVVAFAQERNIPLASHDDTTLDEVALSVEEGVSLAEFPTTLASAMACRDKAIAVMMGAPNLIRGGSHSGNLAARDCAEAGCLNILSSDYVPGSLLMAAFDLPKHVPGIDLAAAIATVTSAPAAATGLSDRGEIAVGLRADLVRVALSDDVPVVRRVWRAGEGVI
jgi:alpha-D-ribose 1-methylphosphonate 5-triphosphate diphosphatase